MVRALLRELTLLMKHELKEYNLRYLFSRISAHSFMFNPFRVAALALPGQRISSAVIHIKALQAFGFCIAVIILIYF
jgi:hypothetical protein